MSDRENLAREMQAADDIPWDEITWSSREVWLCVADIAIDYADRRVAEAVARCARVAEEAPLQGHVPLAIAMLIGKAIRALSPAREGGE